MRFRVIIHLLVLGLAALLSPVLAAAANIMEWNEVAMKARAPPGSLPP